MNDLEIQPGREFRLHPGTRWGGQRLALRTATVVGVHRFSEGDAKSVMVQVEVGGQRFYPTLPEFMRAVDYGAPLEDGSFRRRRWVAFAVVSAGVVALLVVWTIPGLIVLSALAGAVLIYVARRI